MADINCKSCRFFVKQEFLGQCRYFPTFNNKHEMDWCGQHQPTLEPEVKPETKPEPEKVYDINTDTFSDKPKRKYTRRQDAKASA
jgi:hypothetical protein